MLHPVAGRQRSQLDEFFDTPGGIVEDVDADGTQTREWEGGFISASLIWNDDATRVFVDCRNGITGTRNKSPNVPSVGILSPQDGDVLSGSIMLEWIGIDGDYDQFVYQPQISVDGGATWELLAPLMADTVFNLDTSMFPNVHAALVRVMVTDGFYAAFEMVSVRFENPLTVQSTEPRDQQKFVPIVSENRAQFSSGVLPESIDEGSFFLRGPSMIPAMVEYDLEMQVATLSPLEPRAWSRVHG